MWSTFRHTLDRVLQQQTTPESQLHAAYARLSIVIFLITR